MARLLPAVGKVYYNGITFPPTFEAEVEATPIPDTSGRYIKLTKYTITIKAILFPDDAPLSTPGACVDRNMEELRCKLEKAGGAFVFTGQGFSRFAVNGGTYNDPYTGALTADNRIDPTYGPFPRLLSWKPLGSCRAVAVIWAVDVTVPTCCGAGGSGTENETPWQGLFLEYNYSVTWNNSENGAGERVINGYYEIPGFRTSAKLAGGLSATNPALNQPDSNANAEKLWNVVYSTIPLLPAFRRRHTRSLAADKRRMNFTITDTEIESDNPFYPFMVNMDVRHTVSGGLPNLAQVNNTISGSIKTAPGVPRHFAYLAFSKVANERFAIATTSGFPYISRGPAPPAANGNPNADPGVKRKGFSLIMNFSFSEDIYGRDFSFSFSWKFIGLEAIAKAIESSGLFQFIRQDNPNWLLWSSSMSRLVGAARGTRNLSISSAEDRLVFICDDTELPEINKNAGDLPRFIPEKILSAIQQAPPKDQSYLTYSMGVATDYERQQITHSPAYSQNQTSNSLGTMVNPGDGSETTGTRQIVNEGQGSQESIIQQLGPPLNRVTVYGKAIRVGYPVTIPTVQTVSGIQGFASAVRSRCGQIGSLYSGLPIYGGYYEIDLDLPSSPKTDTLTGLKTDAYPQMHV